MIIKRSRPAHYEQTHPNLSFDNSYRAILQKPGHIYFTTGNKRSFTATSKTAVRGIHAGERVIIFRTDGIERARVYECCWTHRTNCNRTYVDCYVMAL